MSEDTIDIKLGEHGYFVDVGEIIPGYEGCETPSDRCPLYVGFVYSEEVKIVLDHTQPLQAKDAEGRAVLFHYDNTGKIDAINFESEPHVNLGDITMSALSSFWLIVGGVPLKEEQAPTLQ